MSLSDSQESCARQIATAYAVHGLPPGDVTVADVVQELRGASRGCLTVLGSPQHVPDVMRCIAVSRVDVPGGGVVVLGFGFMSAAAGLPEGVDLSAAGLAELLGVPVWFIAELEGNRDRLDRVIESLALVTHATVQAWCEDEAISSEQ